MKVIKISQQIKDKNPKLNWVQVQPLDAFVVRATLPNSFFVQERVAGGYANRTDLHLGDGWFDLVQPTFNSSTQRVTSNLVQLSSTEYTYEVVNLTQQEIDDAIAEAENTQDQDEENENIENGRLLLYTTRKRIRRRIKRGLLTANQGKILRREFAPIFQLLLVGDWDLAKEDLDAVQDPSNQALLNELNWLRNIVTQYVNNSFSKKEENGK